MKDKRLKALLKKGSYATKVNRGDKSARSFALSKSEAHDYFKAKKNKKKLPKVERVKDKKDPHYKKLSIEEFEKKYL